MGHMKKYKCPTCFTTSFVIRYGYRKKVIRLLCKKCAKSFSINPCFLDKKALMNDHLDGLSFRKLARKYRISKSQAWDICHEELKKLPDNNQFTFTYCSRFSKIFLFDGKYFNIAGEKYDWVLLWGIDYLRHDIPIITIAPAETYHTWRKLFSYFRILNLHPKLLVCDDHTGLKMAARSAFPASRVQTCYNHFKENVRRDLGVRSNDTYRPFMRRIESILNSSQKLSNETFNHWMLCLYRDFQHDPVCVTVLTTIEKYRDELLGYRGIHQAPVTNNLIEGMNGHMESRLQALRSFQTVGHARLWWNGFILRRRFTPFTDCRGKFRFLRGKTGVEMTKKQGVAVRSYF